jgi:transposase
MLWFAQTGWMAERVFVRDLEPVEGNKLLSIIRRGSGSVVRWRRSQIVLWSAQRMSVAQIAEIAFTSPDRVREVIHNFNADGFDSLAPKYAGGRPPKFTLPERQQIKKVGLSRPSDHGLPFSTWSLSKLAEFLVAEGVVDDISHEGLRVLLREEGVSFQVIKTLKLSNDPLFEPKKNRILELYAIADGTTEPDDDDPTVVICVDEFGPLNLQPHPGKHWAPSLPARATPPRRVGDVCAPPTTGPHGVRHMMGAYDLATDRLYGHVVTTKNRTAFIRFLRYETSVGGSTRSSGHSVAGECRPNHSIGNDGKRRSIRTRRYFRAHRGAPEQRLSPQEFRWGMLNPMSTRRSSTPNEAPRSDRPNAKDGAYILNGRPQLAHRFG